MERYNSRRRISRVVIDENLVLEIDDLSDDFEPDGFDSVQIESCDISQIFAAILEDDLENLQLLLLESDIDPNVEYQWGWTPLMIAVRGSKYKMIGLLLGHHLINVNAQDHDGLSALYFAANSNNIDIIKLLLAHGANPTEVFDVENSFLEITRRELQNWKFHLPEWNHRCSTAKYYPFEFKEIAL